MLEYDFNELDNDFVTLWSKKIVSGEDTLIFKDLTKLAELGQINAIQSWYLLAKDNDDNAVIDNNVENLGNGGANEMLAIAHKDFFKNDRLIQMNEWAELHNLGYIVRDSYEEEGFLTLGSVIKNSVYGSYSKLSIEMYYNNYEKTHNPLSLERFYEMMGGRTAVDKALIDIDQSTSSIEFKQLRKTLLEMYEQDKNNVAVAFALGKNLTLFKANSKLKVLGNQILTELSKRELSKTLQDYEIKGTKRLIKQQIDSNMQAEVEDKSLSAQDKYELEFWQRVEEAKQKYGVEFMGIDSHNVVSDEELEKIMHTSAENDKKEY
ncbi:MAG: hypothetical protein IJ458_01365 [Clostridia bacterium]|nr:hypothetical protein [Clostridia bacterium]